MVLSAGLLVQPFGGLSILLCITCLGAIVTSSLVACCRIRHKALAGGSGVRGRVENDVPLPVMPWRASPPSAFA